MRAAYAHRLPFFAAAVLALAATVLASAVVFRSFDEDVTGRPPSGFTFFATGQHSPGVWEVQGMGPLHHLEHAEGPMSARGGSFAVVGPALKDVRVSVSMRLIDGLRVGGVLWRYRDPDNFYGVTINLQEQELLLYRRTRGSRIQLDKATGLTLDHERWHNLTVVHRGDQIQVHLDGISVLDARDAWVAVAGSGGVWADLASRAGFDDLWIEDLSGSGG